MEGRRSVLVLTNPYDVTADVVLRLLAERRVPVVRLDPGADLHAGASLTATYCTGEQRGTLRTASRELDTTRVRSVWVRRPSPYGGPPALAGQDRRFAAEQSLWGAGGILASLTGASYLNHPWNNRAAEFKPSQLSTAQRCGFLVPTAQRLGPGGARARDHRRRVRVPPHVPSQGGQGVRRAGDRRGRPAVRGPDRQSGSRLALPSRSDDVHTGRRTRVGGACGHGLPR